MQYSPKLKKAMEQIKQIINENDLAAHVVLHTPGFSEYFLKIDPTYAAIEHSSNAVVIKGKKMHWGSTGERDIKVANTCNMLMHLTKNAAHTFMMLDPISQQADQVYETEYLKDGGDTSHEQQNN